MNPLKKALHALNGLHFSQEYLCLGAESLEYPLNLYLARQQQVITDITNTHAFTGYCPLVIVIPFPAGADPPALIELFLSMGRYQPNDRIPVKDALARISLKKIQEQQAGLMQVAYYEGVHGQHIFSNRFHQYITRLNNRIYHRKPGNVYLPGNLYTQVQIAYSLPRNISLITAAQNDRFNLFPTDLHGPAGPHHYIISLRQQGEACSQVLDSKKILLTQVSRHLYKTVYGLGKNHMQALKPAASFPFSGQRSQQWQLPLPQQALRYRELELEDSFIHGIHRLMLFRVVTETSLEERPETLAHIHNLYASWRHNNRLPGNYLLR